MIRVRSLAMFISSKSSYNEYMRTSDGVVLFPAWDSKTGVLLLKRQSSIYGHRIRNAVKKLVQLVYYNNINLESLIYIEDHLGAQKKATSIQINPQGIIIS